ncbi:hypothetical protein KY333_01760 [Candidatus Woesearchaeota archaeon]|nr:hypothetical protein [Candidatus Woesearchaeota archaeon]MBW2994539.1 hypothetical protein [Candidatus Woesearchaeota archaeon]
MKKVSILAILLFLVLVGAIFIFATKTESVDGAVITGEKVLIYEFYGKGCPHCTKLNLWLEEIKSKYPDLIVVQHEIYQNKTNRELLVKISEAYGEKMGGVPTIFIGEKRIVGFSASLGDQIEEEIKNCLANKCISPIEKVKDHSVTITADDGTSPIENPEKTKFKEQITVGAVISAAIVDAINPCAFAVLIILLTTILVAKKKKRALYAGLAFTLSIFLSYFLMGLGLYSAIQAAGLTHGFYFAVAILAVMVGLFNLKDYFAYGKWFVMEVPMSWRPKLQCILKGVTSVPGAFLIGFVVSLFLLPCTSGPYIVILGLLAKTTTRNYALLLLVLYNLIFVMPMLLITYAVYYGFTTTKKAEEWRKSKLKLLHLIAGLIILLLGICMLISIWLGYV